MTAPKGDKPAQQPNAANDANDDDDVKAQETGTESKPVKGKKLGKDVVAGMEHLSGSELLKVQVTGPVVVRRDPETGRVHEHRRGSTLYMTRKELNAMDVSGVRSKSVRVVKQDEDEEDE